MSNIPRFLWLSKTFELLNHWNCKTYFSERNRSYELSSIVETQATNLLKEHPVEFVK